MSTSEHASGEHQPTVGPSEAAKDSASRDQVRSSYFAGGGRGRTAASKNEAASEDAASSQRGRGGYAAACTLTGIGFTCSAFGIFTSSTPSL